MKKGFIFDFDGVICDTEKYHYLAWKTVAENAGVTFTREEYSLFQSRGRKPVIEYIAEKSGKVYTEELYSKMSEEKSALFSSLTEGLSEKNLINGIKEFLIKIREKGGKTSVASSSENAGKNISVLNLGKYFDAVADGTEVAKKKPDPEVFLVAAKKLNLSPAECVVFEDSVSGVEGALKGGFSVIGVGEFLFRDDIPVIKDFSDTERTLSFI